MSIHGTKLYKVYILIYHIIYNRNELFSNHKFKVTRTILTLNKKLSKHEKIFMIPIMYILPIQVNLWK